MYHEGRKDECAVLRRLLEESDARRPIGSRDCLAIAALGDVRVTGADGMMMMLDDVISYGS